MKELSDDRIESIKKFLEKGKPYHYNIIKNSDIIYISNLSK